MSFRILKDENIEANTDKSIDDLIASLQIGHFLKEGHGDRLESVSRPLAEPIDRAAVNQSRKLTQTSAEYLSNRTVFKQLQLIYNDQFLSKQQHKKNKNQLSTDLIQMTVCKLFRTRFVYDENKLVLVGGKPASCTTGFMAVQI